MTQSALCASPQAAHHVNGNAPGSDETLEPLPPGLRKHNRLARQLGP
jgi:hypothetical protein